MDQKQQAAKDAIKASIQSKDFDAAKALLEAYQKDFSQDTLYFLFNAIMALETNAIASAEEHLFSAYQLSPDRFEVLFLLGNLYEQKEDFAYALEWYRKARKVANPEQLKQIDAIPQRIEGVDARLTMGRRQLSIFVRKEFDQFLGDLEEALSLHFDVKKVYISTPEEVEPAMEAADICWFEWCDEIVAYASHLEVAKRKPIVCRLHRYEVFTDIPTKVRWERIDTLMLVADHLKLLLKSMVPDIEDKVRIMTVKNGVNLEKFPLQPRTPGFKIACVGYLHARKNPMLLLQIMAKLVRLNPRYELHVAGKFQDALVKMYWNHMIKEMNLEKNVIFDGWQDDVNAWLADKQYIITTSMHESFGYSVAEAMAQGMKPIVHNFPFAADIWPEQVLFNTVDEAVAMVAANVYSSTAYRNFIEKHYSFVSQLTTVRQILAALPKEGESTVQVPMFKKGSLKRKIDQLISARATGLDAPLETETA